MMAEHGNRLGEIRAVSLLVALVACGCSSDPASNPGTTGTAGATQASTTVSGTSGSGGPASGLGGSSGTGVGGAGNSGNVLFFDDFDQMTLGDAWIALNRHGDYGNNEIHCYSPANAQLTGGNLVLTAKAESQSCGDSQHAPSRSDYTSAMVQWRSFNFTYGTVEFKAKMTKRTEP